MRIAPVGLVCRPAHWLDHQDLVAILILPQPSHQPVVKAAHFDHRHILLRGGRLVQLFAKLPQLGPARADLATKQYVTTLVSQRDRHLLEMKVDSEIQHDRFSWSSRLVGGCTKLWTGPVGSSLKSRKTYLASLS